MLRSIFTSTLMFFVVAALMGCEIGVQEGEEGKIRFKSGDPMFGDYPYAVGVSFLLEVEVTGLDSATSLSKLTVQSSDTDVLEAAWEDVGRKIEVEIVGPGSAAIEVLNPDETLLDRLTLEAAVADRLLIVQPRSTWLEVHVDFVDVFIVSSVLQMVEGGFFATRHLVILDAEGNELAGRMNTEVSVAGPDVVAVGPALDEDGELRDEPVVTNRPLLFIPLGSGDAEVQIVQGRIGAETTFTARVLPPEEAVDITLAVHVDNEAAEEGHMALGVIMPFLRDAEGEVVHGGLFQFSNQTPELAELVVPQTEDGDGMAAMVMAKDDVGMAIIAIEERLSQLSLEAEVLVGPAAPRDDE